MILYWIYFLASLDPGFLLCKIQVIISNSKIYSKDQISNVCKVKRSVW